MMLKLLVDYYRWLWGLEPLVVKTLGEPKALLLIFGAVVDIGIIIGIIGLVLIAYNDRKRGAR